MKINDILVEFAAGGGGNSGNYFQELASAWYNGAFDTGSLEKGIKSKEDVERLLNRGIVAPDGVTRKYAIDYNAAFDGVVISSDDYYEHSDYNDQGQEVDSRNGQAWGPNDYMEFKDEELDEGVAEGLPQTLRKVVPGYAKREIDRKMDDQKFGRTDVDRDANYYRYKKIQDKIKDKGVAEGDLNELSTEKLAQYKTAAGADARKADAGGDYARGDKRFKGINQATNKQFDNDLKKHGQQDVAEGTDYQAMVSRVKKLAGMGPLKTQYDPAKRVYRNVPTAVQPKKEQR